MRNLKPTTRVRVGRVRVRIMGQEQGQVIVSVIAPRDVFVCGRLGNNLAVGAHCGHGGGIDNKSEGVLW